MRDGLGFEAMVSLKQLQGQHHQASSFRENARHESEQAAAGRSTTCRPSDLFRGMVERMSRKYRDLGADEKRLNVHDSGHQVLVHARQISTN
jgi:hypothetical protein